ncbi:MAG: hypothetical protein GEU95_17635 [Rhizobiales bacterium]|nr:hypothetical protein [Hyphomicrobiales bacterium]
MVDLPKIPRRLVTVEEPRSGLTARDIAAPYASIAQGMADVGDALETVAEAGVEDAAARGVTVGADGQLNIERTAIPMVGKAGQHYERLIKTRAVVDEDTRADGVLIELREANRGNPAGFKAAAEAYRDERVSQLTSNVGPAAGLALKRQIDNRLTQTYSGLLSEHQNIAIKRSDETINTRITTLADEMETLARRNGIGVEYEERLGNVRALLAEKVNNPLLAFPQEKADAFLDTLNTRVRGAAINEQVERIYRERGFEAARTYLRTEVRSLDGKVKQLHQIERAGLAWLNTEEKGFRAERDAIAREWTVVRPQVAERRDYAILLRDQATAVGNHRVASAIDMHLSAVDHLTAINALPARERAFVYSTGTMPTKIEPTQRAVQATVENEARRQGVDERTATTIAWRESRLGASPIAATSSARGVFQLLKSNRERLGIGPDAPVEDQVRAGVTLIKETTDQLRTTLGREPTPAEVYMGHFQGAGTAAAIIQAPADANLKIVIDAARPNYRGPNGETWGDRVLAANPKLTALRGDVATFRNWADYDHHRQPTRGSARCHDRRSAVDRRGF